MKQYTYMMLKPDAFRTNQKEAILTALRQHDLTIEKETILTVDMDVMKILLDHYKEVIDSMDPSFDFPGKLFHSFYYDGPHRIMPMLVSYKGEQDIISYTRALIGKTNPSAADPETIRGTFSADSYALAEKEHRLVNNIIHASDSHESAKRELAIWAQYLN